MEATKYSVIQDQTIEVELNKISLFNCLSEHQVNEIGKFTKVLELSKGEHIYLENEDNYNIYFLEQGSVKLYHNGADGKEVIRNIIHPNNIFGEEIFSGLSVRSENAKAIDPEVRILVIHIDDLKGLLQRYWEMNQKFIELITLKLNRAQNRCEALIVDDARKRVIDFLKLNAQHKGKKIGFEMLIKHSMTQQDIANYTGTSRQTVTSILNDLRKSNKIYFKRNSILIRDINNLN